MVKDSKLIGKLWNKFKKSVTITGLFALGCFTLNPANVYSQTGIDTTFTDFYTMYEMPYSEAYKNINNMNKISKEIIQDYKKNHNTNNISVRLTHYKDHDCNEITFLEKASPHNKVKYNYNKNGVSEIDYYKDFYYYKIEKDNNGNGVIDKTYYKNRVGTYKIEYDLNEDGIIDKRDYLNHNKVYKTEYDLNEDGIIDKTVLIKNGKPHVSYNRKDKIKKRIRNN